MRTTWRWPRDHDEGDLIVSEMDEVIPALVAAVQEQHATGDHYRDDAIRQAMEHQAQLALRPGPVRVDVIVDPPWSDGQINSVQVVTGDRPFLVDTVASCLLRHGWRVEDVRHPIIGVKRDRGTIEAVGMPGRGGCASESWIHIDATAPLGTDIGQAAEQLRDDLCACLDQVVCATDDWGAMHEAMLRTAELVSASSGPADDRDSSRELLEWLADDHFMYLSYQEFTVDGETMTPVAGTHLGIAEEGPRFDAVPHNDDKATVIVTKDSVRSAVQRNGYRDYIGVRIRDEHGAVVAEHRFLGLLGSAAYTESVAHIPVLRAKASRILALSGYRANSHSGKAVVRTIAEFPRDDFFEASAEELVPLIMAVVDLREKQRLRALVRRGPWGRFFHLLVFVPADRFDASTVGVVEGIVAKRTGAVEVDSTTMMGESSLVRITVTAKVADGQVLPPIDDEKLQAELADATSNWDDEFITLASGIPSNRRGVDFGPEYKQEFTAKQGILDLELLNGLAEDDLGLVMYRPDDPADPSDLRLKIFNQRAPMTLSQVMPHLSSLGVQIIDEHPHRIILRGREVWLFDLGLQTPGELWKVAGRRRFTEAFAASWKGECESDTFSGLVTEAGLSWSQVAMLRCIARYLRQLGSPFSQTYMARVLRANPNLARDLVGIVEAKFDPTAFDDGVDAGPQRLAKVEELSESFLTDLEEVASLDHDRILRMMHAVIRAMIRTNWWQSGRRALAFKVRPTDLGFAPAPRPKFEIFVNSPRVSGTHLRFGAVARGGLRWSDRPEDFRTEVLGLVKAQMVKNSVIVPAGAKGGFVPAHLPDSTTNRAEWAAEGKECYRIFVSSLLSLTDNVVEGKVVAPEDVVRHDGDDPYLVVAADKGTATFSDTANAIAAEHHFWLGDAFASGGSHGYDHKAMGITARGAWESVTRHLADLGIDQATEDFTCVGIGDMSGDVFGNGMLLSRHIKLVAAFNHRHVFVDPNPDPEASWQERRRLFNLPRSSWGDYDSSLISEGGGVWDRTLKSIPVSPHMHEALGIDASVNRMTPDDLISAILRAPVDLLWNGGIGTYVRATSETDAQVGDRANDPVRVTAKDVRAKAAGEGGNLGWTQAGRIEYARNGGRINTDFIDNSAGVDTSDHEVNIKILLDAEVAAGRISEQERDELLPAMADDVASLVLRHNHSQNLALANALSSDGPTAGVLEAWMCELEESGHLDRAVDTMPSTTEMNRRMAAGERLASPELCTLLAWTKIALCDAVLATDLPEDPFVADRLVGYFPPLLRERFTERMPTHRLHREIITTEAVNRFVDSQGITAYYRLHLQTGADIAQVIRCQLAARSVFGLGRVETDLTHLGLDAVRTAKIRLALTDLAMHATRWFLNHGGADDIAGTIETYRPGVATLVEKLSERLLGDSADAWQEKVDEVTELGLDRSDAAVVAAYDWSPVLLSIVEISEEGHPLDEVADAYLTLARRVDMIRLTRLVEQLPQDRPTDARVRASLRVDLLRVMSDATRRALVIGTDNVLADGGRIVKSIAANPDLAHCVVMVSDLRSAVGQEVTL
ncbi:NAD-glutamate dehydrogenase [Cutibacterium acnes]|uniref:NAD-glutamate dehydrogenase n=1 Tax=Cutibacterium acnes TaxID=1747 RepID=UPI000AC33E9F|nr:NAD-glutamate dehydrogenase [Cutibacterium acnes]TLG15202.1 NAD-glutamate dehydrogenase [Cutibacterium acnes]TLG16749.1 NAD-glutamate dehydrogenase [Cutibacterium acnes]TLG24443.1 NAD-glutamate dehydrogenase [Cutibacterium acnes]TMT38506.1 NAD-glutamate dehydrogenase [Cutibacterium acnes]TMT41452.1 NAD-glutamate dehydrogenase [Cutibacterium acnes]